MKELIRNAREAAKAPEFLHLVDSFEKFSELFSQKERAREDAQESARFLQQLDDAHKNFWLSFEKVSSHLGITPELMKAYFENPNNFSPELWQDANSIKQEIFEEKSAIAASPKKLKKNNRKMRI